MMKKIAAFVSFLLAGSTLPLAAQNQGGDLNRQLEVTRAYEPTVDEARKIDVKPNMVDTVALRPDLQYGVMPVPYGRGFEVSPIRAAIVNVDNYRYLTPFYARVAVGYPFQTLGDLYYNSTGMKNGRVGLYANHYGSWSKITNDSGDNVSAPHTFNRFGVNGERYVWGRYTLDGEIGYDHDKVTRYGYFTDGYTPPMDFNERCYLCQYYSTVRARIGFGDDFEDLSRFNFRVRGGGAAFRDRYKNHQADFRVGLDFGKRFGNMHDVTLGLDYNGYRGSKNYDAYSSDVAWARLLYGFRAGIFTFALGADYTFNRLMGENHHYLFPRLQAQLDLPGGYFSPYVEIDGKLTNNDYRSLSSWNPYLVALFQPNTVAYNGRAGFRGSIASAFSYRFYGGVTLYKDYLMPVSIFSHGYSVGDVQRFNFLYGEGMGTLSDSLTMWTVGVDLEGRISGSFTAEASVAYKGFTGLNKDYAHVFGVPDLTARLALRYSLRDKLILTLGGTFQTACYFASLTVNSPRGTGVLAYEEIDATFDLSFGAEYRITKNIAAFVQGNNLINQKLYPYYHYPGLGINVLGGVKLNF